MRKLGIPLILAGLVIGQPAIATSKQVARIPMHLELHRPYVDLSVTGPSGHPVKGRFWLDTGGGAMILSSTFADKLGLQPAAKSVNSQGMNLAPTDVPALAADGMPLKLTGARAFIVVNSSDTLEHTDAVGALPLRMLRHYHVVVDYPDQRFTVAGPGALKPEGRPVDTFIGEAGMPVVSLDVGGKRHTFLLDTGATYCMMSADLMHALSTAHPDWPSASGTYGPANMLLGVNETTLQMLRIEKMQWGPFELRDIGAVSRPAGTYEKWMSKVVGKSVFGSIGGNLLQAFRVDIDFPRGQVYLGRNTSISDQPINTVGIVVEPAGGGYVIAAGTAELGNTVQTGDRLLKVDGVAVTDATLAGLMARLDGRPGDKHQLTLRRGQQTLTVTAPVEHLL
ncbi:MAG: aspartyl protease family protein [Gammaproteobacteria bacterium]|jgi:hypothetical protein